MQRHSAQRNGGAEPSVSLLVPQGEKNKKHSMPQIITAYCAA